MAPEQLILILCIFGAVAMVAFLVSRLFMGSQDGKLRHRLTKTEDQQPTTTNVVEAKGMKPLLERLGQAAAEPFMPKTREKQSSLKKQLGQAGIYSPKAVKVITGAKVLLLGGGIFGGYAIGMATGMMLMGLSVGGLFGYLVPQMWLRFRIKANQKALNYGLADALDLMVVCVEAGLTVDAAMQRVGQELSIAHPAISRELAVTHMETRVGVSRLDALKNMGGRTQNQALQSLASMLTQAERFGTSIGGALRIHADTLRQARQHAAEEMAAKASVKMSFPLVLFIFPATFIVLAGPTVIGLMNSGML
ncbi:MAG TPA: type II secretion system F family protein [Tepidisphaeraceae bacterium]|jgi:tight adherence protein C